MNARRALDGGRWLLAAGLVASAIALTAQQPQTSAFTAEQAAGGRAVYAASCASCHLPDLAGRNEAPQLAGNNFMNTWRNRSTRDLFEFIQSTMPPTGESLSADQYLAVTAFILQANGAAAGTQAFTATTAVPIGTVASGPPSPGAASGAPGARQAQTTTAVDPTPPAGGRGGAGGAPPGGGRGGAAGGRCGAPGPGPLRPAVARNREDIGAGDRRNRRDQGT